METGTYIIAIELGTSKIVAIAGCKQEDGTTSIVAVEHERSADCIKRGCIQNVDEAASRVKKAITKLSNRIPDKTIEKVYVGIAGQSLHSISHSVCSTLPIESAITHDIIKNLLQEGYKYPSKELKILHVIPNEYFVDKCQEANPVGVIGSEVEARIKLITARPSLKKKIEICFSEKVKMPIAGYITTPLATAAALLTEEDKKLGCALVDFGAGTTTLSVYKDNMLRYLVTIPFGGKNITNDICSLNLLENDAEILKKRFSNQSISYTPEQLQATIEGLGSTKLKYQTLFQVMEARSEEIVANVNAQLVESRYAQLLPAGIVITGGASNLQGIEELLAQKTGLAVRQGTIVKNITFATDSDLYTPDITAAIGLVLMGTDSCTRKKEAIPPPPPVIQPEVTKKGDTKKEKKAKKEEDNSGGIFGSVFGEMGKKLDNFLTKDE